MPADVRPAAPAAPAPAGATKIDLDESLLTLVENWRLVVADLALHYGVDLYDPAVRGRPWPGVRTMIFSLLDSDTRLRRALTRR
ncbi:hypothetical protein [Microbacterium halophytorum]|uniref:hypothetical protein n=1 Tax=Microbacterium halophytorum TaxID=2067568 RepID=UPI000CFE0ECD|nr:hypothetical protein [Microbacterium halophytorum]